MGKQYFCLKCDQICDSQKDLEKHLARKNPCDSGEYKCDDCGKGFSTPSNRSYHKKNSCKGRVVPKATLLERQVAFLTNEINRLTVKLNQNDTEHNTDSEQTQPGDDPNQKPAIMFKCPENLILLTTIKTDAKKNQVYFFECGAALRPLENVNGILVKFGSTDEPYERLSTHRRDFEGGRLIDSVLTNNEKAVESEFKKWMKVTGRIVSCKTAKKKSFETEVFVAKSQEDYAMIVAKAKELADDYIRDVELLSAYKHQIRELHGELHEMQHQ